MDLRQELIEEFAVASLEQVTVVEDLLARCGANGGAGDEELRDAFESLDRVRSSAAAVGLGGVERLAHAAVTLFDRSSDQQGERRDAAFELLESLVVQLREVLERPPCGPPFADELHAHADELIQRAAEFVPGDDQGQARARFGEVAVDLGLLDEETVARLLEEQCSASQRRSLGALALEAGLLEQTEIRTILAEQTLRLLLTGGKLDLPLADPAPAPTAEPAPTEPTPVAPAPRTTTVRVAESLLGEVAETSTEIERLRGEVEERLPEATLEEVGVLLDRISVLSRQLAREAVDARSEECGPLLESWSIRARQLGAELGRAVDVECFGGAVEAEHDALALLDGLLGELVPNAVLHGIEPERRRLAADKPATGRLELRAYRDAEGLCFEVGDDGRGIDPEGVRRALLTRELCTPLELERMTERELLDWIPDAGVTPRDSRRTGAGLALVARELARAGGRLEIDSQPGAGTCVRIRLRDAE